MNKEKVTTATLLLKPSTKLKALTLALTLSLIIFPVAALQLVTPVKGNMMSEKNFPIYILSDGSIEPSNSLLKRTGNIYNFTGSSIPSFSTMGIGGYHVHTIVIQRDNIILDGDGYELNGPGVQQPWSAITIDDSTNVTVTRVEISNFRIGIAVSNSSNINITQNKISSSDSGIIFASSNCSIIARNDLAENYNEVSLKNSSYNNIIGNILSYKTRWSGSAFTNGFSLSYSNNNLFIENNITALGQGVKFDSSSNNTFCLNDFINNSVQIANLSYSISLSKNIWDDGVKGNFWTNYLGLDNNNDGIGDSLFVIDNDNVDRFPLLEPVYVSPISLPISFDKESDHSQQTADQTPSLFSTVIPSPDATLSPPDQQLISLIQEYINYTISNVNGSLWATVDGVYPMHISPDLVGKGIQMVYPTPHRTTPDITITLDGQQVNWSNFTEANPGALHYTYLGDWPMIACTILPTAADFLLTIHYQHPIMQANGTYIFLYDLNIDSYLSYSSINSTAHFSIKFETNSSDINVFVVPGDSSTPRDNTRKPVDFSLSQENNTQRVSFDITSNYSEPVPGDELIVFQNSQIQAPEFPTWIMLSLFLATTLLAIAFIRNKMKKKQH